MNRWKYGAETARVAIFPAAAAVALSLLFVVPSLADIYRWEDEGGVIHFTDDLSGVPREYRGKVHEIQKTPPGANQTSVSTMGSPPSTPPGSIPEADPSNVGAPDGPGLPEESDAAAAVKLRAKIDAKERFLRAVDEKRSLSTNPYRNRFVSPEDLELYGKYKEELPRDREHLKALEPRLPTVKEP